MTAPLHHSASWSEIEVFAKRLGYRSVPEWLSDLHETAEEALMVLRCVNPQSEPVRSLNRRLQKATGATVILAGSDTVHATYGGLRISSEEAEKLIVEADKAHADAGERLEELDQAVALAEEARKSLRKARRRIRIALKPG